MRNLNISVVLGSLSLFISLFVIASRDFARSPQAATPTPANQTTAPAATNPPATQPAAAPKTESRPLSAVGAIAAESIRTKWQEINAEYGALQQDEREKGKLGPEWTLDVLGNRMIHQIPATQQIEPAPQTPIPAGEPDKKSKKK